MKPKLYRYQYFSMIVLFCLAGIFLPGILERSRGTASYPALLIALPVGVIAIWLMSAGLNGEGGIAAISRRRLGKSFGTVSAIIYIVYFVLTAGELFCFYGLYISAGEDSFFYLAPITLVMMLAALCGTTALGRTAMIFAPLMLIFAFGLSMSGLVKGNYENFVPFTMLSWGEIGKLSLTLAALEAGHVIAVMAISPAECRRAKLTIPAVILPNLAVIGIAAAAILIDGQTPLINRVAYFSPKASGDFSELKVIAEFVLFFCTAFRICVCLRAASVTTAELMYEKDAGRFVAPYAFVILGVGVMLSGNIGALAEYLLRFSPIISLLPIVVLPVLLAAFRRKERKA